jgi:type II secretory pathway pseudopilin PulG
VLLVIVIIGVLTAVTLPSFVRSMQGNRLRSAARMVAAAGRYARSMAVLHQRPVVVSFLLNGSQVVVDLVQVRPPLGEAGADAAALPEPPGGSAGEPVRTAQADEPSIRIERALDGVRIVRFHLVERSRSGRDRDLPDGDGVQVVYESNGRTRAHEIVLEDGEGQQLVVAVDMLGSAEIRER